MIGKHCIVFITAIGSTTHRPSEAQDRDSIHDYGTPSHSTRNDSARTLASQYYSSHNFSVQCAHTSISLRCALQDDIVGHSNGAEEVEGRQQEGAFKAAYEDNSKKDGLLS